MKPKQEHSAGGVVYKHIFVDKQSELQFLLGKHSGYHKWVLPKGLIEDGESMQQTAVRETQEEMGVTARVIGDQPLHQDQYQYKAELKSPAVQKKDAPAHQPTRRVATYQEDGGKGVLVNKTVTFFLMKYQAGDPADHGWEMTKAGWFSYQEALKLLDFATEREALKRAHARITKQP